MDNYDLNSSLASGVYLYRKMRNLSTEECASELGISKTTLIKIEQRKANPTLDTVALIAKNMGCEPLSLLGNPSACNYFAAILLMNLLEQGNQYSLDTLQQAVNHLQAALDLLLHTQRPSKTSEQASE